MYSNGETHFASRRWVGARKSPVIRSGIDLDSGTSNGLFSGSQSSHPVAHSGGTGRDRPWLCICGPALKNSIPSRRLAARIPLELPQLLLAPFVLILPCPSRREIQQRHHSGCTSVPAANLQSRGVRKATSSTTSLGTFSHWPYPPLPPRR